mmetsp:Transcript_19715/g.50046  ORF Transcript_19715/g.50046 Transcript_19715/m.50046 type:complete len:407 (-) Transcript_19715:50-1270(-)
MAESSPPESPPPPAGGQASTEDTPLGSTPAPPEENSTKEEKESDEASVNPEKSKEKLMVLFKNLLSELNEYEPQLAGRVQYALDKYDSALQPSTGPKSTHASEVLSARLWSELDERWQQVVSLHGVYFGPGRLPDSPAVNLDALGREDTERSLLDEEGWYCCPGIPPTAECPMGRKCELSSIINPYHNQLYLDEFAHWAFQNVIPIDKIVIATKFLADRLGRNRVRWDLVSSLITGFYQLEEDGGVVLLCPHCASKDAFRDATLSSKALKKTFEKGKPPTSPMFFSLSPKFRDKDVAKLSLPPASGKAPQNRFFSLDTRSRHSPNISFANRGKSVSIPLTVAFKELFPKNPAKAEEEIARFHKEMIYTVDDVLLLSQEDYAAIGVSSATRNKLKAYAAAFCLSSGR